MILNFFNFYFNDCEVCIDEGDKEKITYLLQKTDDEEYGVIKLKTIKLLVVMVLLFLIKLIIRILF